MQPAVERKKGQKFTKLVDSYVYKIQRFRKVRPSTAYRTVHPYEVVC